MTDIYKNLKELDDYKLVNGDQDLRGSGLYTSDGTRLGTIKRMLVDPDHDHVAALVLDDGRGVPVEAIEIRDGDAYVDPVDESLYFTPADRKASMKRGRVMVSRY